MNRVPDIGIREGEGVMAEMSRREFLEDAVVGSAVAGLVGANAVTLRASPLGLPIGSQVYPLRTMLKDFPAFIKMIADVGVTRLELCSPIGYGGDFTVLSNGKEVKLVLADHGMKAESSHFSMGELRNSQEKSIEWAKDVGITQMITASLGEGNGGNNPTMDQVKRAAEEYNKIAAVAAKAGIQQGLHNEGFELSMIDGKRTYDMLFDLLDPQLVKFQFQMSTITAGLVGAEYFLKYPGRFISMHLQDVDMNAPVPAPSDTAAGGRGGRGGRRPQVAVGKGTIDWVRTFTAAKTGGVKNYFVEQNWELTQLSVAYLKNLTV
jgi:sugar phosphate isomerase/epimerase